MKTARKSTGQQGQPQKPRRHSEVKTLGRYVVDRKLGEGGMGTVYHATDSQLGRVVALKVLPLEKAKDPRLVKRFRAEAQAAAQLKHKNIVGVYDSGEIDGFLYIAMEFVDGIDVHELVKRKGVLDIRRTRDIIRQVAHALQHAYEQNIVHRDIKPSNLMIDREGKIRLADMGLARSLDESDKSGITRAGTTVGTVDYMSPEQTRDSRSADTRSDMYSLGATWYHMLTGKPLFPGGDLLNRIHAHATQPPPNPQDINDEISDDVVEVMHRMLRKEPADRYQTPNALLEALDRMSLKKRAEIDKGLLSGLMEEDDETSRRKRKRPTRKKRPARKTMPQQEPQPADDQAEDDGADDLYGFRRETFEDPEPHASADDESDMDLAMGDEGGDVNLGLLAALAEEDDADDPAPAVTPRKSPPRKLPPRQRPASTDARKQSRSPDPRSKAPKLDEDRKRAPAKKTKRPKQRPRREPVREDTASDTDTTEGAMPSRREVMLGRGSRHGRTGSAGSAAQDRSVMLKTVGIVIAVGVIGWFAMSAMTGGSQTPEPQPSLPGTTPAADSPAAGTSSDGTPSAPRSGF